MAVKTARAQIAGNWYTLTYNAGNGRWEATINAPNTTSYNQPDHYYACVVEATNDAGTTSTATASELEGLRLRVLEKIAPTISITSPGNGAYTHNAQQAIEFTITDEIGGSGVDLDSIRLVIDDGEPITQSGMICTPEGTSYRCIYTPSSPLDDGSHTVTINASDHDGNAATQASVTYTVDTVPPELNVSEPSDGITVSQDTLTVRGMTSDMTSTPVVIKIAVDGVDQGMVTVEPSGQFAHTITLSEGSNVITVTAADASGQQSTVTINVTLDTSVPKITSATITPNPVDAGATMIISVVIE